MLILLWLTPYLITEAESVENGVHQELVLIGEPLQALYNAWDQPVVRLRAVEGDGIKHDTPVRLQRLAVSACRQGEKYSFNDLDLDAYVEFTSTWPCRVPDCVTSILLNVPTVQAKHSLSPGDEHISFADVTWSQRHWIVA